MKIAIAALGAMVVGGLGPWAKAPFVGSVSGTEGDGWLIIAAAVIAGAVLWRYAASGGTGKLLWVVFLGVASAAIGIYDLVDIESNDSTSLFTQEVDLVQIGWGLYVAIAGSIALAAAAFRLRLTP